MTEPISATTAYHTQQRTQLRQRRYAQRVEVAGRLVHPDAPHGQAGAYQNWGCRCQDCTDAAVESRRRWRKTDPKWTAAQYSRATQKGHT